VLNGCLVYLGAAGASDAAGANRLGRSKPTGRGDEATEPQGWRGFFGSWF
jgi:hypothetical protein